MIGGTEIFVVLLIALLLFGPAKLPEIARQIGRAMGDFRRVADETMNALQDDSPRTRPSTYAVSRDDAEAPTESQEQVKKEPDA